MTHSFPRWLILIALILVSLCQFAPAQAQTPTTRLDLERAPIQDSQLLVVDIKLSQVQDLYGTEIQISYPPELLTVKDNDPLTDGDQILLGQLLPETNRLVVINSVDKTAGVIKLVVTMLSPAPAISGNGTVASIIFQVKDNTRPIEIRFTSVKLISINLVSLPYKAYDLLINNDIAATPQSTVDPAATSILATPTGGGDPPQPPTNNWVWVLGGVIGLMVMIALGLWWQRGHAIEVEPRKMPTTNISSSRSASMLVRQGNEAMSQQKFEAAYEYFSQAVELDPANAAAWLGKGLVAQQVSEKRICLQQALRLDPDNDTAKIALQQVEGKK